MTENKGAHIGHVCITAIEDVLLKFDGVGVELALDVAETINIRPWFLWSSGAAGVLVGHPFDTVKVSRNFLPVYFFTLTVIVLLTFLPTHEAAGWVLRLKSVFAWLQVRLQVQPVDKPLYRGTYHCFQSIIRQESVCSFFSLINQKRLFSNHFLIILTFLIQVI